MAPAHAVVATRSGESHPYPNDTRRVIWRGLNESLLHWPGYTWMERCAQRVWIGFMLLAPRALVESFRVEQRVRRRAHRVAAAAPGKRCMTATRMLRRCSFRFARTARSVEGRQ